MNAGVVDHSHVYNHSDLPHEEVELEYWFNVNGMEIYFREFINESKFYAASSGKIAYKRQSFRN